ncbi:MAG: right-handed parallel beta-helix repeat-containing protein, partial [Gammaproteobacteria bacterium]|nr:right-handed parallel beta-helix repeat-containing protein [Gammaproteobacteria bacterium]
NTIRAEIYDHYDNPTTSPYIDFSGYLDGPGGNAVGETLLIGAVDTNMTLTAGSSYFVLGATVVDAGVTLTIEEGVTLSHLGGYIQVKGDLVVTGTAGNEVVFTSGNQTPSAGNWSGVMVVEDGSLTMDYGVVEYAGFGASFQDNSGGTVTNSIFRDNTMGFEIKGAASPLIDGNTMMNNSTYGVRIVGWSTQASSTAQILNNTITNNTKYGVYVHGSGSVNGNPLPVFHGNSIHDNVSYDFYTINFNGSPDIVLDAGGNWWGTSDFNTIRAEIYDHYDNPTTSPYIDFSGYLDGPGGNAVGETLLI